KIASVADRGDAGLDRDPEAPATERVTHHLASERVRFVDERLHLVERERRVPWPVSLARAGAAGRAPLNDSGARPDHRADDVSHVVHATRDATRKRRVRRYDALVAGRRDAIAD